MPMLDSGAQKITMNKPYTLDFDGLDGLYKLNPSDFIQSETKKSDKSLVLDEQTDIATPPSSKKPYLFLLGFSLLAIGSFFAYTGKEEVHKNNPIIEPVVELKDQNFGVTKDEVLAKETKIQTVKQEKQILQHKIQNIQEQIAQGEKEKFDLSKDPATVSNNDAFDKPSMDEEPKEIHTVNAANLNPSDIKKPLETVQHKEESIPIFTAEKKAFDTTLVENLSDKAESSYDLIKPDKNEDPSTNLNRSVIHHASTPDNITRTDVANTLKEVDKASKYTLRFDFNKATIDLPSTKIEKFLKSCPDEIEVVGHTCNLGAFESNQAIGLIRAEKVKDLLVNIGFSKNRIKVKNAGQKEPIASNKTYAGRALNRRVVINCFSH